MTFEIKSMLMRVAQLVRRHWMSGLGLLAAAIAFYATQQYAEDRVAQERTRLLPAGGLVEVIVAARDLAPGDLVSATTVAVRQIPRQWALVESVNPVDFDSIHQLALTRSLKAGQPITLDHLRQAKASVSGLRLDPGFRAVSISVDEVSSVGGLIQPGDRVDLWAHVQIASVQDPSSMISIAMDSAGPPKQARLVAENLKVIATGAKTERSSQTAPEGPPGMAAYSSITLAVPEHIAAMVLGGTFQGRLGIALRAGVPVSVVSGPTKLSKKRNKSDKDQLAGHVEILMGGIEGAAQ